jgi:hypothetical protein
LRNAQPCSRRTGSLIELIDKHAASPRAKAEAQVAVARFADRPPETEVVLALLGDWHERTLHNLPLLARLSLASTVAAIQQLGFVPTVVLVPLASRT